MPSTSRRPADADPVSAISLRTILTIALNAWTRRRSSSKRSLRDRNTINDKTHTGRVLIAVRLRVSFIVLVTATIETLEFG